MDREKEPLSPGLGLPSWLAGSLTLILTCRRICRLGAPITCLWRYRELYADPLWAIFWAIEFCCCAFFQLPGCDLLFVLCTAAYFFLSPCPLSLPVFLAPLFQVFCFVSPCVSSGFPISSLRRLRKRLEGPLRAFFLDSEWHCFAPLCRAAVTFFAVALPKLLRFSLLRSSHCCRSFFFHSFYKYSLRVVIA